jgi:hypothetical protein
MTPLRKTRYALNFIATKVGIMTRIALSISALSVILCWSVPPSRAATYGYAPWCAVTNLGGGVMDWDCEYASAAECAPAVVAGNRGFCNVNPYWADSYAPGEPRPWPRAKHHHRHHVADH